MKKLLSVIGLLLVANSFAVCRARPGRFPPRGSIDNTGVRGRMLDTGGQVYNAKAYGVRCDGFTDDSVALQRVFSLAGARGGIVFIPAGTCKFSRTLTIGPVGVQGAGVNTTTLRYTGASGTAVHFNFPAPQYAYSPGISNLSIAGPGSATNTTALTLGGTLGAIGFISRNLSVGGFGTCLKLTENTGFLDFSNFIFSCSATNLAMADTTSGEQTSFTHGVFNHDYAKGVFCHNTITLGGPTSWYQFVNDSFDGATMIVLSGAQVSIYGAHFENTDGAKSSFVTVGNGTGSENVYINGSTVSMDGPPGFLNNSPFHIRSGGTMAVSDTGICDGNPHRDYVMTVDAGGYGFISNDKMLNCAAYFSPPNVWTGAGRAQVFAGSGRLFNELSVDTAFYRLHASLGRHLSKADFSKHGWGPESRVELAAGTDSAFQVRILASAGASLKPTITLTFADGVWNEVLAPSYVCNQEMGPDVAPIETEASSARMTLTFAGTPSTGTYGFSCIGVGRQ